MLLASLPPGLTHCTLTGVDARTDLARLAELAARFPFAEWGLLYSPAQQGLPGRYPPVQRLQQLVADLPASVRVALHVCGDGVPALLARESPVADLATGVAARGGRIQLNFNLQRAPFSTDAMGLLRLFISRTPATVITQHNKANAGLVSQLEYRNHAVLFDSSGGRGLLPPDWPTPLAGVCCGYAGGLGPLTIARELPRILEAVHGRLFWIDMENALREHEGASDWFSLDRAEAVLAEVARVCELQVD